MKRRRKRRRVHPNSLLGRMTTQERAEYFAAIREAEPTGLKPQWEGKGAARDGLRGRRLTDLG